MSFAHYGDSYLKADQFKIHPEYFAFYDGKRQPWHEPYGLGCQVCNSNPEVAAVRRYRCEKLSAVGRLFLAQHQRWLWLLHVREVQGHGRRLSALAEGHHGIGPNPWCPV